MKLILAGLSIITTLGRVAKTDVASAKVGNLGHFLSTVKV